MAQINLEEYNYHLPPKLIAQTVAKPRDHCRLMILHDDEIEHKEFYDLIDYLQPGDVLVLNESKVQHCLLVGEKDTGGKIEVILTRKISATEYEARIKGNRLRKGATLLFHRNKAIITDQKEDIFFLRFAKKVGEKELQIQTPPYIKQKVPEKDYQTVFARVPGSLAAPTAGLHFTPRLLRKIMQKGVKIAIVQLHISFETFLPIRDVKHHNTGKEYFFLDQKNAEIINSGRIVGVGTTVVKCLESCTWDNGKILPSEGYSTLFITPGYKFKTPFKAMITNFHLPKSSLLLLTAAFAGKERLLKAYHSAVEQHYRFFSLGDAMMIFKGENKL